MGSSGLRLAPTVCEQELGPRAAHAFTNAAADERRVRELIRLPTLFTIGTPFSGALCLHERARPS